MESGARWDDLFRDPQSHWKEPDTGTILAKHTIGAGDSLTKRFRYTSAGGVGGDHEHLGRALLWRFGSPIVAGRGTEVLGRCAVS